MTIERTGLALRRVDDEPADIYLDDIGHLALVKNTEAVGQHARQRLMAFHGEWFLDKEVGVIWLTEVLGQYFDPVLAEAVVKIEILGTDGVTEITSFSARFDQELRHLKSDNISVKTVYDSSEVQL